MYQGTYKHKGSSQRWVTLGKSRQVKLLFYSLCSYSRFHWSWELHSRKHIYLVKNLRHIISIFSLSWTAVVTEKGGRKSPNLQFICNKIPLDTVFFYSKCSVSVYFLPDRKAGYGLNFPLPTQTTKNTPNEDNQWIYQKVWEICWNIPPTNKPLGCMTPVTGRRDHKWEEMRLCQPVWFIFTKCTCYRQTRCYRHLTFMIASSWVAQP